MTAPASTSTLDLVARFPDFVTADTRPGFSGFIVKKENLVEVATPLRDEFSFDLLSSVTGVDYIAENKMEVVYHAHRTTGGPGIVFKTQADRIDPVEVPSLINVWAGADFQEREAWDLMGIKFTGHPDLRRILMWEGYEGHPLRKDWQEPFYEEDFKPFKSRWPDGKFTMAEDKNPLKDNLKFPQNFDPEKWILEGDALLYGSLARYTTKEAAWAQIASLSIWGRNTPPPMVCSAQHSSRSASNPGAMTPPSRTWAPGSAAMARIRRSSVSAGVSSSA